MTLYQVFTEKKNKGKLEALASRYFTGYNLAETDGVWKGKKEKSLVFSIVSLDDRLDIVTNFAKDIKYINDQETVLVTTTALTDYKFI